MKFTTKSRRFHKQKSIRFIPKKSEEKNIKQQHSILIGWKLEISLRKPGSGHFIRSLHLVVWLQSVFFLNILFLDLCVCVCVIQVFGKIAIAILSYGFVAPLKYKYYFHCHRCFFVLIFFLLGFLCVFVLLRALENTAICTLKVKFSHIKTKPFQCK